MRRTRGRKALGVWLEVVREAEGEAGGQVTEQRIRRRRGDVNHQWGRRVYGKLLAFNTRKSLMTFENDVIGAGGKNLGQLGCEECDMMLQGWRILISRSFSLNCRDETG